MTCNRTSAAPSPGGTGLRPSVLLAPNGPASLVQCKQWKVFSVSAPVIREMFGLMTAENADEAVIVTSGKCTPEAQSFAEGKPIRLIDGPQLLALVQSVQPSTIDSQSSTGLGVPASQDTPACPLCGESMILRTARRGTNVGSQFWGCSTYPPCKATRPA
jgi:restriction system protein